MFITILKIILMLLFVPIVAIAIAIIVAFCIILKVVYEILNMFLAWMK